MWRAFWCAIVAVLTMQHLNHSGVGKLVMFEVHYHHQWKHFEMLPFLALGVVGGAEILEDDHPILGGVTRHVFLRHLLVQRLAASRPREQADR